MENKCVLGEWLLGECLMDMCLVQQSHIYACVYVPEFAMQARVRQRPDLVRSAVAILAGEPPLEQVCSLNTPAVKLGIAHGMTRAELESFPGLCILRRSEAEEQSARAALLEVAGAFTPRIEVPAGQKTAFVMVLDMTGTTRIFGNARQSVDKLLSAITTVQFSARLACCSNFHAAISIAPSARKAPVVLSAGQERDHLSALPLSALNLKPQQADTLEQWGLHTLGELADLPEGELIVRLGQEGKRLRLLARGEHTHLMVPEEPVFNLEEFLAFDAPVELLDSLLFVLGPMLDHLLARAQNRCFALASVTVKLGLDGGGEHIRTIKPALPVCERAVLLKLLHLDLQAHPPPAGIVTISAHAETGDRSKVQFGLFAPQLPEPLRLDVTLARISALVGEERVGRARLLDSYHPEGFVMERFDLSLATPRHKLQTKQAVALRRCRPPITVTVQHESHRLASFCVHGKQYTIQDACGPWRRSGDWWSSSVWAQEEWDVRATSDRNTLLCLITHNLLRQRWHLAGLYD